MIELGKYMVAKPPMESTSGKTKVWEIVNSSGAPLGLVSWYGPWRCYVFYPEAGTLYNAECMQVMSDFTHCVTAVHKAAQLAARRQGA